MSEANITVKDPFGAADDPALPALKLALDPFEAKEEFKRRLPRLAGGRWIVLLRAMRVIRHKPGKRCVIEYDVKDRARGASIQVSDAYRQSAGARRYGKKAIVLLEAIWNAGFQSRLP